MENLNPDMMFNIVVYSIIFTTILIGVAFAIIRERKLNKADVVIKNCLDKQTKMNKRLQLMCNFNDFKYRFKK